MRLARKDCIGLALAACTVVVLVIHGGRHDAKILAFVDVSLLSPSPDDSRDHRVVVVRDGVVTRVGSVGSVGLPPGARVIDGGGTAYLTLVRGTVVTEGPVVPEGPATVFPGAEGELVLLPADPRIDPSVVLRPWGRVVDGTWRASTHEASATPTVDRSGGH